MFIFLDGGLYGCFFFFFQAEDGIRDYKVTGVQTCALPIYPESPPCVHHRPVSAHRLNGACWPVWRPLPDCCCVLCNGPVVPGQARCWTDRKSTRLNSSHLVISYAVFCLKKKKSIIHSSSHL